MWRKTSLNYGIIYTKILSTSWGNCFVYFKYPWESPWKSMKKALEIPGFPNLLRCTNPVDKMTRASRIDSGIHDVT